MHTHRVYSVSIGSFLMIMAVQQVIPRPLPHHAHAATQKDKVHWGRQWIRYQVLIASWLGEYVEGDEYIAPSKTRLTNEPAPTAKAIIQLNAGQLKNKTAIQGHPRYRRLAEINKPSRLAAADKDCRQTPTKIWFAPWIHPNSLRPKHQTLF